MVEWERFDRWELIVFWFLEVDFGMIVWRVKNVDYDDIGGVVGLYMFLLVGGRGYRIEDFIYLWLNVLWGV